MGNAAIILESIVGPMTIGLLVRAYRVRNDLTQEEVGAKLGVPKSYVSDLERNKKSISLGQALGFADALGESRDHYMQVYFEELVREAGANVGVKLVAPNAAPTSTVRRSKKTTHAPAMHQRRTTMKKAASRRLPKKH